MKIQTDTTTEIWQEVEDERSLLQILRDILQQREDDLWEETNEGV